MVILRVMMDERVALSLYVFFFSSRRRHTRFDCDWSSDVCSSDLASEKKCHSTGWPLAMKLCQSGPWIAGVAMKSLPAANTSEAHVSVRASLNAWRGRCEVSGSSRTDG